MRDTESEIPQITKATEDSARTQGRRAPAPPAIKLFRLMFSTLGRALPGPACGFAYRLWFTTRRFPPTAREREVLAMADRFEVEVNGEPVVAYSWGQGPAVLLVHGWHGAAANFVEFVEPLTRAGFRAIAFDAPAHGASPGKRTKLPEFVDAMAVIASHVGAIRAIIGHSFGVMCSTSALMMKRITSAKIVCISTPAHFEGMFTSFSDTLGLPPGIQKRFRARLERDFGRDIWVRLSPENQAKSLNIPALIIHDAHDKSVPFAESEALSRAWAGSKLFRTEGLGHRRILADTNVIRRTIDFMMEQP